MSISILSYGYQKPSNPTFGDLWFPALEADIQQLNDHNHNGTNSAPIGSTLQTVSSGAWGADLGGGTYRQLMTCPGVFQYDTSRLEVRRSTGEAVYPTLERVSATTFYIYTNDNSLAYKISYV